MLGHTCHRATQAAIVSCVSARCGWLPKGGRWQQQRQRHGEVQAALQQDAALQQSSEQLPQAAAAQQQRRQQQGPPPRASPKSRFEELMQHARLTHIAQDLWQQIIRPGDVVVDATCGNGHDTAFLARAVGASGTIHAFDVQEAAIQASQRLVEESVPVAEAPAVHYHLESHAHMLRHVGAGTARVIVFNLGFLPGSDKMVITQESSTVAAVQASCEALRPGGLMSLLCYTGHPGGMEEFEAVKSLVAKLPPAGWVSSEIRLLNRPTAPVLLLVWKRE